MAPPRRTASTVTGTAAATTGGSRIKNYLPVRLCFPDEVSTFLYVKEHVETTTTTTSTSPTSSTRQPTLFVANCPCIPNVSTKRLLQAVFGRYGEVSRVTVIANPRRQSSTIDDFCWTDNFAAPSFLHENDETTATSTTASMREIGKFAHVVFASTKELKQAMRSLTQVMNATVSNERDLPAVDVSTLELQTLMDDSHDNDDEGNNHGHVDDSNTKSAVLKVAARYRASCRTLLMNNRQDLLDECNRVMAQYEEAVDAAQRQRDHDTTVPDEDGFITVSYSSKSSATAGVGIGTSTEDEADGSKKRALEMGDSSAGRSGGRDKRTRRHKKKNLGGADPLPDFYRFQTRDHRQKTVHELRRRFEEDVKRVQSTLSGSDKKRVDPKERQP